MKSKVNAVIFDMDGLLIDSEIICYQLNLDMLMPYGYHLEQEDYTLNYSGKTAVTNMTHLIEQFQLPISVQEGLERMALMEKAYLDRGIDLHAGAKELLAYLKENHFKIALATSSAKERAMKILTHNQVEFYFDEMVFGPEVKRGKPFPDVFLQAAEKLNEKPENCLVLEDSEAGIQAAYAAGIPVICIPDMKMPGKEYAEMTTDILGSLTEVIGYLDTI